MKGLSLKGAGGKKISLLLLAAVVVVVAMIGMGACGEADESTSTSGTPDSSSGASTTSTMGASAITRGGVLKVAINTCTDFDPAVGQSFEYWVERQIFDPLLTQDEEGNLQPCLATEWTSADAMTWTIKLRPGVTFSNGAPFTSRDVKYTFDRLLGPLQDDDGSGKAMFKAVKEVTAPDDTTVVFSLTGPLPDFPYLLNDFHVLILSEQTADPRKEYIGTGPFEFVSESPDVNIVLKANPNYWGVDANGEKLPYLDGIEFIQSNDATANVDAFRAGELDVVAQLSAEAYALLQKDPAVVTEVIDAGVYHDAIHMRCDVDPFTNPKLRLALRYGTDGQAIAAGVMPGLSLVGNTTPVSPAFRDWYLDVKPYDPEKAKSLLAEAGYPQGLTLPTMIVQTSGVIPAIATVWKEQMAAIGVTVEIETVPVDVYYGDTDKSWNRCALGITDWGARPTPAVYFNLAYTSDSEWNESWWFNPDFDAVVEQINSEADSAKRAELYKQAQEIMIDQCGTIVPYFVQQAFATTKNVEGVERAFDVYKLRFTSTYFAQQ